jgi:CubicO group peptidase (beta-lactamase class C family)
MALNKNELQSRLAELIKKHKVVGAAVGVLHNGEVTEAAAGVTNLNTGVEVTPDTVFQIGSMGKSWTATVVMQMVDEGKLDLDVPIRTYLPEFKVSDPDVSAEVTLRHILPHTSGIDGDHFPETGRGDDCLEKYVETCADLKQTHPMGATMSYCNTGYSIMGRVIEVVDEKVWDQSMRDRMFAPLQMTRTGTLADEAILHRVAVGHIRPAPDKPQQVTPMWTLPRACGPMGIPNSTVGDILQFARTHLQEGKGPDGNQLISPGSAKAMIEPQIEVPDPHTLGSHWGLGFILFDWNGRKLFGHDGNTIGQASFLRIAPDASMAITMLTNGGSSGEVYRTLFSEIFSDVGIKMPEQPTLPQTPLELDLTKYAGTFERLSVKIELEVADGRLEGTTTLSGPLAAMIPNPVEKISLAPVDDKTFLASTEGERGTPSPAVFYDFEDGIPQYLHMGARTHPRV